jgi:hypothetical protein
MIRVVSQLYEKYIRGTEKQAVVQNRLVLLCSTTRSVNTGAGMRCKRIYISTRVLKHVYDKRPAEEFDFLVGNVHQILKYPDRVFKNKDAKKGDFCFLKKIHNSLYLASIEIMKDLAGEHSHCEVITFFRVQKESYLNGYELLWEWKVGEPSS